MPINLGITIRSVPMDLAIKMADKYAIFYPQSSCVKVPVMIGCSDHHGTKVQALNLMSLAEKTQRGEGLFTAGSAVFRANARTFRPFRS